MEVVRFVVNGSGADAVARSVNEIGMQMDAQLLPDYTPMLIEAADLRTGAALVDLLAVQGLKNTWLVTQ